MKKLFSIFIILLMLTSIGNETIVNAKTAFKDVNEKYWAVKEIQFLTDKGIIQGFEDGTFKPNANLTRIQIALMVTRDRNYDLKNRPDPRLKDINKDYKYYDIVSTVVSEGIFKDIIKNGEFKPNAYVTRAEMSSVLARAYHLKGESLRQFKDVTQNHWAYSYIQAVAFHRIATGYGDGTFKPNSLLTRAEFAVMMSRTINDKFKPNDPFAPPAGWVAPKINTTATADKAKNAQILDEQLGFLNTGGTGAIYNPFKKAYGDTPIKVFLDDQPYDASIQIDFWRSQDVPEYNKIPYVAKELFKFYQVPQVYDIVNKGFTGTNIQNQMNKMLTFGNRQVKIMAVGDSAVIFIGKPGGKYDNNWNVIK
ncbi:S-layer homology domain-containing protein [Ureibacillus endophyticus]|uniref:S-layer homology domain-containing protein n=1 Tax=Ureibacillus endophyticus TaxID=1978490 RepID=A0A494Z1T9_9BACL|nr:S-layer homology domain-containing protein [Lysinibacillus endophyticus]RKQ16446.1 S-layer homology domain-containing protein [Lysinibacillus endophyticus]